jgi:hypothetical protein
MNDLTPKYDVAISFLSKDEPIASALYEALSCSLQVFFYPRNQEELAGTDGFESMRKPFLEDSRVTVILYRALWGQTPWTRVEEAAIKDGCLKYGWHRLFFLCLDATDAFPVWLPHTHVRFSFTNFGLEQAVGAIKGRVQECGGVSAPVTALSRARLVHAEAERIKKRDQSFRSAEWMRDFVHPSIVKLFSEVERLSAEISSEIGIKIRTASNGWHQVSLTNDRVGVSAGWQQQYTNVMGFLVIFEYSQGIILPHENKYYGFGAPQPITTLNIQPDLSLTGDLCWKDENEESKKYNSDELADKIVTLFINLSERANRGELDTTPEFFRRSNQAATDYDPFADT